MQVVDRNGRLKVEITSTVDDISIGVTTISGGTNGRVLYDNAGVVGEIAGTVSEYIAGDGSLQTFPTSFPANKMVTVGRNATGSTLYKGTIVYILGSTGNRPNFVKAQANTEATSAGTFGVIESDISNNSDGNCVTIGTIDNLDTRSTATHPFTTDTLADGDTIYLSPTTAGYVTNVKPYAPSHLVYVGKVVRTSPTNGTIVYRIQNGYELDELHDVAAQTPSNNDALAFETSTQLWKPKSIPTLLGYTPVPTSRTITINGTTQDLSADRTFTISTGITIGTTAITSGVDGRLLFQNAGVVSQSANMTYDNTNGIFNITGIINSVIQHTALTNYTGFGGFQLNVSGGSERAFLKLNPQTGEVKIGATGSGYFTTLYAQGLEAMRIFASTRNVGINTTTDAGFKVDINGTARVSGVTLIGSSLISASAYPLQVVGGAGGSALFSNTTRTQALNINLTTSGETRIYVDYFLTGTDQKFILGTYANRANQLVMNTSGNISIGTTTEVASAQFQIESTTKGFLPPRQTQAQRTAIASPAVGLQVYQTDGTEGLYIYKSTGWALLL